MASVETFTELPKPERALLAVVETPSRPVTVISWGAPNAAGEGRDSKEGAYAFMSSVLAERDGPIIVGVDTNAWSDPPLHGMTEPVDPLQREQDNFTGRAPRHGLRDVFRALVDADEARSGLLASMRPHGPLAVTYIRRPHGRPRGIVQRDSSAYGLDRMDRLYVSDHFDPLACEHFYDEARDAGGDHALVLAELSVSRR